MDQKNQTPAHQNIYLQLPRSLRKLSDVFEILTIVYFFKKFVPHPLAMGRINE